MSWSVDHEAVNALAGALGITKPVSVVKRRFDHPRIQGAQQTGSDGHIILLGRTLDPEKANFVLCHELRHCWQQEMLGDEADEIYTLFMMLAGYRDHPLEADADEFADATAPRVRLIREVK